MKRNTAPLRVFTGQEMDFEAYSGFNNDQWLITPDGDPYIHLKKERGSAPTFRLASSNLRGLGLTIMDQILDSSISIPEPDFDVGGASSRPPRVFETFGDV